MASHALKIQRGRAGLCPDCGAKKAADSTRCPRHRDARRKQETASREERRDRGLCLSCADRAIKDRSYCQRHLDYYAERSAKAAGREPTKGARRRGRPAGPATEAITVRIPVTIMARVRESIGEGDSLTSFVARALLAAATGKRDSDAPR